MQVFASDLSYRESAQALDDKRLLKMVLESSQLLSCALNIHGMPKEQLPCRVGWKNHPCARWAANGTLNFGWLYLHLYSLCEEYTFRFGKIHSYEKHVDFYTKHENIIPSLIATPFYNGTIFKNENIRTTDLYRCYLNWKWKESLTNYSKTTSRHFLVRWTKRMSPGWAYYYGGGYFPTKEMLERAAIRYPKIPALQKYLTKSTQCGILD